ncbi:hypothetical protein DVH05_017702 [Phytophthora capsici]|nr:hypothetical protein DVH05_004597 [Phytophthora capsici]KAG1696793.1 hypothetical protein DVH05_017702 [Phytophthora capsici]
MRISTLSLLLATVAVVLSSCLASKGEDPSQSIANVDNIRGAGRFLRAQAQVDEERVNLKLSPESEKWLAGLAGKSAAELEKAAQAPKNVNPEKLLAMMKANAEEHFMNLAKSGVTPKIMRKEYNIKRMRKVLSKDALMRNANYQEYERFKEFWNKLPKKLKREFLAKAASLH